jgi:hypothetical protein
VDGVRSAVEPRHLVSTQERKGESEMSTLKAILIAVALPAGGPMVIGCFLNNLDGNKIADAIERQVNQGIYKHEDHFVGCASDGQTIVAGIETNIDPVDFLRLCDKGKVSLR